MIFEEKEGMDKNLHFEIIESTDPKDFTEKVNGFTQSHMVHEVTTTSASFTQQLTKYIAHVWHSGLRSQAQ